MPRSHWPLMILFYNAYLKLDSPDHNPLSLYGREQCEHYSKRLLLCFTEQKKSYLFAMTWVFHFWLSYPFKSCPPACKHFNGFSTVIETSFILKHNSLNSPEIDMTNANILRYYSEKHFTLTQCRMGFLMSFTIFILSVVQIYTLVLM